MERVFVEDYVVAFLKQKKTEAAEAPIRLALYGYSEKNDNDVQFFIYGAACEEENRSAEEIGREFFDDYNFLGFVNIYNNAPENLSNYNIFFEKNEAMQDYLIFCRTSNRLTGMEGIINTDEKVNITVRLWRKFKMIMLGWICIFLAITISTIDDYDKMNDFIQMAERAIVFSEENG